METNERPTFLTILCILSFIGIGLGFLSNLFSLATAPSEEMIIMQQEQLESLGDDLAEESGLGSWFTDILFSAGDMLEHTKTLALVGLVALLICLFGVLEMWKLRKRGYFIYSIGNLISPIATISLGGWLSGIGISYFVFPVLFIVLYGLNLKHMS